VVIWRGIVLAILMSWFMPASLPPTSVTMSGAGECTRWVG
jgi:hypothetical protein